MLVNRPELFGSCFKLFPLNKSQPIIIKPLGWNFRNDLWLIGASLVEGVKAAHRVTRA